MKKAYTPKSTTLALALINWLTRLEGALIPDYKQLATLILNNVTLTSLSPLKRAKNDAPNPPALALEFCREILLGLLRIRGCEISLSTTLPKLASLTDFEALTQLWHSYTKLSFATKSLLNLETNQTWNESALLAIAHEIGRLDNDVLNGAAIALLSPQTLVGQHGLRKRTGNYYTPASLAAYIVTTIMDEQNWSQKGLKILDPACGSGSFLIATLDLLVQQFTLPASVALTYLYGLELDHQARDLTVLALLLRASELAKQPLELPDLYNLSQHIQVGNALIGTGPNSRNAKLAPLTLTIAQQDAALTQLSIFNTPSDGLQLQKLAPLHWPSVFPEIFDASPTAGFDIVLGNPPYVGFNDYSGIEKAYFAYAYPEIYTLKSDLLYYFIKRGIDLLKEGGRLGFVTSRFWKEAAWATRLREWLTTTVTLDEIRDFGAEQLFKEATVDVCLLFATKKPPTPTHQLKFVTSNAQSEATVQLVEQSGLGRAPWAWINRPERVACLLQKINEQSLSLGELAYCRTGIQTGYDKAFFFSDLAVPAHTVAAFETGLLKKAIKNSDLNLATNAAAELHWHGLYLLYPPTDLTEDECLQKYPVLARHLQVFRARLEQRRRYEQSFPFCQLQWPREQKIFEANPKLVTPYKASRNTFGVDRGGYFFSTDLIAAVFKQPNLFLKETLEQCAANFLCSSLATFQFRSYSKPVGGGQYDYYANPVKRLALPASLFGPAVTADNLAPPQSWHVLAKPALTAPERDQAVYELYKLTSNEIALLEANLL